jgi:hypothetical protein
LHDPDSDDVNPRSQIKPCTWRFLSELESVALRGSGVVATFRASRPVLSPEGTNQAEFKAAARAIVRQN